MQTIEIKTGKIGVDSSGNDLFLTTIDLIKQVLDSPPAGGFTLREFKWRDRIDKAISKGYEHVKDKKYLKLEDADYAILKSTVNTMNGWNNRSPFVVDFVLSFDEKKGSI